MSKYEDVGVLVSIDQPHVGEGPTDGNTVTQPEEPWWDLFLYDRYDLRGANTPYEIIPLTRGYFAVVDKKSAKRVKRFNWYAELQKDPGPEGYLHGVYAARRSTKSERKKGAPNKIYLHRFIAGTIYAGNKVVVDHRSRHGLDNRRQNLKVTDHSGNLGNMQSHRRTVYADLLRGVEPIITSNKDRSVRKITGYHGVIQVRGKRRRSKTIFRDPGRAHQWYCKMHARLFPHGDSWNGTLQQPLVFPPELKDTRTNQPHHSLKPEYGEMIPF